MYRSTSRRVDPDELSFSDENFELLKKELKRLRMTNEEQMVAIRLCKVSDFVSLFFLEITTHNTKIEAFNYLNDVYFEYFGKYRFSNYQNFLRAMNNYLKNRRNDL